MWNYDDKKQEAVDGRGTSWFLSLYGQIIGEILWRVGATTRTQAEKHGKLEGVIILSTVLSIPLALAIIHIGSGAWGILRTLKNIRGLESGGCEGLTIGTREDAARGDPWGAWDAST